MQAVSRARSRSEGLLISRGLAGDAPGWPGDAPTWAPARKTGVGTACNFQSKVWFTLTRGALSEIYYPSVDQANTREVKFFVTDGSSFVHDETRDTGCQVRLVDPHALEYELVNTEMQGRYRISKKVVTHPRLDAVMVKVRFDGTAGKNRPSHPLRLFLYIDPHIKNSGWGDCGRSAYYDERPTLISWDGDTAMACMASAPWLRFSSGFVGRSDGVHDLYRYKRLVREYDQVCDGNVGQIAEIDLSAGAEFTLTLGFGANQEDAARCAAAALDEGFERAEALYRREWNEFCSSLDDLGGRATPLYYSSSMILKTLEDKLRPGAFVASLSFPWGDSVGDENQGGYHLVWSRDLYHVASAFMAMGREDIAKRALDYLRHCQQRPDGSFPQNSWVDGRPYWGGTQMDETAYPILLAWRLGRYDLYHTLVKKAADYILAHGPATPQERWEECSGYSPSTLACEVAALVCASDIARRQGDLVSAQRYLKAADEWHENIDRWCFTTSGWHGTGRYYVRISENGSPNMSREFHVSNDGGAYDQREIVDPSFLELVRLGLRAPYDPFILESVLAVDQVIRVETPKGPGWYRYNHDGYGETLDGQPFRGAGKGRLWPILTGERGHYELARGNPANDYLAAMESFANEGLILPEQVWETSGEATGSAAPLGWSHAEYVRLLKSHYLGRVWDTPDVVRERYESRLSESGSHRQVTLEGGARNGCPYSSDQGPQCPKPLDFDPVAGRGT